MSCFTIRRESEPYILFNKDLKIVIVELNKLNKFSFDLLGFKEKWCYFIGRSGDLTREDREYLSRDEEIKEVMEHFAKLSEEEKLQEIAFDKWRSEMDYRLDRSGWIEFGEKKGLQKGREGISFKSFSSEGRRSNVKIS